MALCNSYTLRDSTQKMAHIGQIDHDLDQTDGSDDNEPDHLDPNLPLLDAVRDLYSTDPTQEISP